jgi:hypothetical protein
MILLIAFAVSVSAFGSSSSSTWAANDVANRTPLDHYGRPMGRVYVRPARPPTRDSDTTFVLVDTLNLPNGFSAGPGQFSKDGLTYYVSRRREGTESLYVLSRARVGDPFGAPQLVAGRVNETPNSLSYVCQPSITADGTTLVFVRSDGYWVGDDLYLATRPDTTAPFDSVRPLTEINDSTDADAYPWISPDGLRLYYTKGSSLAVAARESLQGLFGTPQPLPMRGGDAYFGAWLTDDETETYCGTGYEVSYAWRTSPSDSFSVPVQHPEFSGLGFVAGPSVCGSEFYLFCEDTLRFGRILIFTPRMPGIEEERTAVRDFRGMSPMIVRCDLPVPQSTFRDVHSPIVLLDISGRRVLDLHSGANDVSRFGAGVYFVLSEPSAVSREPSTVRKVVIAR